MSTQSIDLSAVKNMNFNGTEIKTMNLNGSEIWAGSELGFKTFKVVSRSDISSGGPVYGSTNSFRLYDTVFDISTTPFGDYLVPLSNPFFHKRILADGVIEIYTNQSLVNLVTLPTLRTDMLHLYSPSIYHWSSFGYNADSTVLHAKWGTTTNNWSPMTSHINGVDSYIASGNKDMVEHMLSLRKVATIGPTSSAVVVPATEAFVVTAEAYGNDYGGYTWRRLASKTVTFFKDFGGIIGYARATTTFTPPIPPYTGNSGNPAISGYWGTTSAEQALIPNPQIDSLADSDYVMLNINELDAVYTVEV